MGNSSRGARILGVFAACLLCAARDRCASAGETGRPRLPPLEESAASPEPALSAPPRLRLVWIDVLDSAPYAFQSAARETSAILADAGVQAAWTLGSAATVTSEDELKIVLLPETTNGARLPAHVMGGTRRGRQSHTTWVYLSNVLWALGLQGKGGLALSVQEQAQVARALGRVVAHEIVHAVAPEVPHSAHGLMAGKLGRAYLLQASAALAPAEQAAFRAGLRGFASAIEAAPAPLTVAAGGR